MTKKVWIRWGECFDAQRHLFSPQDTSAVLKEGKALSREYSRAYYNGDIASCRLVVFSAADCIFMLDPCVLSNGELEWTLRIGHIPGDKRRRKKRADAGRPRKPKNDGDADRRAAMPERVRQPPPRKRKAGVERFWERAHMLAARLRALQLGPKLNAFLRDTNTMSDGFLAAAQRMLDTRIEIGGATAAVLAAFRGGEAAPAPRSAQLEARVYGAEFGMPMLLSSYGWGGAEAIPWEIALFGELESEQMGP